MSLTQFWNSGKVLPVLPCACAPASCSNHYVGRNQPFPNSNVDLRSIWTNLIEYLPLPFILSRDKRCHLLSLPVELLQEIVGYLDPHDRITFTLTCKALHSTLGSKEFSDLKKLHQHAFIELLTELQRDLPEYRLCRPCMTLHPPTYNTIKIPRNKLRRQPHHPQLRAYLLAPDEGNYPDILYWLCGEHLQRAISKEICLSTLRCSGSIALGPTLPKHPALNGASFHFKATPALSRRNIIFHAEYELTFNCAPCRFWSEAYVRSLLLFFDLRCCLHCSTGQMQDEIICFLFHGPNTPLQQGVVNTCVRATDRLGDIEEGCGHHIHVCECATEYKIEPVRQLGLDVPVGVKVLIWQWLGHRSNDYVLRQKGVLRNLYEDAAMEMEWEASRTGIAEVVGD